MLVLDWAVAVPLERVLGMLVEQGLGKMGASAVVWVLFSEGVQKYISFVLRLGLGEGNRSRMVVFDWVVTVGLGGGSGVGFGEGGGGEMGGGAEVLVASWTTIAKFSNAALGENSTWTQVKEHFKSLKRRFALYEEVLKLSGWGWDPETQTPIPGYEGAWDEALRVNSRFSTIKKKPFPLYDQMQILCKNSICTGALVEGVPRSTNGRNVREGSLNSPHMTINDYRNAIPAPPDLEDDLTPDFSHQNSDYMMSFSAGQHIESNRTEGSPMTQNNATSNEQGKCRRKWVGNKGKGKLLDKDVGSLALQMIVEASRERNAMLERLFAKEVGHQSNNGQPSGQEIPSIQDVLRDLKNIPNLPYRVFLKGMNLFTDPNMRLVFSVMADEDKVEWLTMMTLGMNMWSDQMDITLLEMLDDELKLGGGAYLQFSEQTWEFMARGLNAITGVNYPVSTIKTRITFYKIVYYIVEDMVGTAGFA
ncbi:hypothetical protein Taro_024822 [Colocasia esculenta]|uniref:Myb/SANT-like domain-containing protein n=1 Tax=Colocasia esculenta TaxID=4460 RepID=A0A843VER2_COLES|nr:hypothetical protein [Colocasia esculenta]